MFVENARRNGRRLANVSLAQRIIEIQQEDDLHRPLWSVEFSDDRSEEVWATYEEMAEATSTLVPAHPDAVIYRLWYQDGETHRETLSVLAWALRLDYGSYPVAVTVDGYVEADGNRPDVLVLVQHPDGRVEEIASRWWDNIEEAIKDWTAERKAAQEATEQKKGE